MGSEQPKQKQGDSVVYRVLHSPIFVAASGIGVLMMAFTIDSLREYLSIESVAVGTGLFLFIVLINLVVNNMIGKMQNQDYFDSRLEVLNNIILSNNLNWLVNQKYVQMIEMQADEVWAFAPELTYAIQPDSAIFKAIQVNLARGSRYKIFMPNTPETHRIIADYRRLHDFKPGQVQFVLVPHEEYVFHTIIVIYDPLSNNPHAIEWLPIDNLVAWLEMDRKHTGSMIGIGEVLIKRYLGNRPDDASFVREIPRGTGKAVVIQKDE